MIILKRQDFPLSDASVAIVGGVRRGDMTI
jgi:hypothetical protein